MAEATRRAVLASGLLAMSGAAAAQTDAFGFRFRAIEGGELPLSQFRGRPMLVVNTASFCGYTPQYAGLQRLHERYGPRGLVVLGVPSQEFRQESGDEATISQFCDAEFGITFPMTGLERLRGRDAHPFYLWLAAQAGPVGWNFHKYLVWPDGLRVQAFATGVQPEAPALLRAIEAALAAMPGRG
ncbi:MAG: glutathione peroxidase [Acetobacteraceae bacterium]|nr:glutathione peroxidase [Acetobacteraceae bacterium]